MVRWAKLVHFRPESERERETCRSCAEQNLRRYVKLYDGGKLPNLCQRQRDVQDVSFPGLQLRRLHVALSLINHMSDLLSPSKDMRKSTLSIQRILLLCILCLAIVHALIPICRRCDWATSVFLENRRRKLVFFFCLPCSTPLISCLFSVTIDWVSDWYVWLSISFLNNMTHWF